MPIRHYDRQGKPISMDEWGQALRSDPNLMRVAETTLPDGKWVSTVWLGLDHGFGGGPPVIFETMVFASQSAMGELDQRRYSTEAEALQGHEEMVAQWSHLASMELPPEPVKPPE